MTALVVLTLAALWTGWQRLTLTLTNNNTYVYGHAGTLKIHGHTRKVDLIAANQLVDHSLAGRMRGLLGIQTKYQFTRGAVVHGGIRNVKLVGPGLIKIVGSVDHSTLISRSSPIIIEGRLTDDSHVSGLSVYVTRTQSDDSTSESEIGNSRLADALTPLRTTP